MREHVRGVCDMFVRLGSSRKKPPTHSRTSACQLQPCSRPNRHGHTGTTVPNRRPLSPLRIKRLQDLRLHRVVPHLPLLARQIVEGRLPVLDVARGGDPVARLAVGAAEAPFFGGVRVLRVCCVGFWRACRRPPCAVPLGPPSPTANNTFRVNPPSPVVKGEHREAGVGKVGRVLVEPGVALPAHAWVYIVCVHCVCIYCVWKRRVCWVSRLQAGPLLSTARRGGAPCGPPCAMQTPTVREEHDGRLDAVGALGRVEPRLAAHAGAGEPDGLAGVAGGGRWVGAVGRGWLGWGGRWRKRERVRRSARSGGGARSWMVGCSGRLYASWHVHVVAL